MLKKKLYKFKLDSKTMFQHVIYLLFISFIYFGVDTVVGVVFFFT